MRAWERHASRSRRVGRRAVLLCGLLLFTQLATAEVYRSIGPKGEMHYNDEPPSKDAKPVTLPPIQVVSPPSRPTDAAAVVTGAEPVGASPLSATIVSPTPNQVLVQAGGEVPVTVSLSQLLPEGFGLEYLLDGRKQTDAPTRKLNFTLSGAGRGEHLISVVTVDASGAEVGRAAPVIVHVKPPAGAGAAR